MAFSVHPLISILPTEIRGCTETPNFLTLTPLCRNEALQLLSKSPFFGAWDPAVLRIYIECATYPTTDASGKPVVRLKMPGIQEAIVFSETHTEYEVFHRLPELDERIALKWIMPGKPGAGE
jgi:hypothetical protein